MKVSSNAIRPKKRLCAALPMPLVDFALIDGPTCALAAGMSLSQWLTLVREGKAPAPAVREVRYTRWTLASIRTWLIGRVAKASSTSREAGALQAARPAAAARSKRAGTKSAVAAV